MRLSKDFLVASWQPLCSTSWDLTSRASGIFVPYPPWREISSFLTTLAQALFVEISRVFKNSVSVSLSHFSSQNSKQSSFVYSLHSLDTHLEDLYKILNNSVSLCLPLHSLSSKVFSNLEVSPLSPWILLVCHPNTFSPELDSRFRCTLLVPDIEFLVLRSALLAQPKEPRNNSSKLIDREIYLSLKMNFLTYIYNIHS